MRNTSFSLVTPVWQLTKFLTGFLFSFSVQCKMEMVSKQDPTEIEIQSGVKAELQENDGDYKGPTGKLKRTQRIC